MSHAVLASCILFILASCERPTSRPSGESTPAAAKDDPRAADHPPLTVKSAPQSVNAAPLSDTTFRVDGFSLGDRFSNVMKRQEYARPCDDDPIDHKTRRAMVYGAMPCRNVSSFDGTTSVVFIIGYGPDDNFDQPIVAFAWLGGDYFAKRSNFPLSPGVDVATADKTLGDPLHTFKLPSRLPLSVREYAGHIYALIDKDRVAGFVVGAMPDAESEQWRVMAQMYRRYTPRVARSGELSRAECERLMNHALNLTDADMDPAVAARKRRQQWERKVGNCLAEIPRTVYDCAMAAKTAAAIQKCQP